MADFIPFRPDFRPVGPTGTFLTADPTKPYGVTWTPLAALYLDAPFKVVTFSFDRPYVLVGTGIAPIFYMTYNRAANGAVINADGSGQKAISGPATGYSWTTGTFKNTSFGANQKFTLTASGELGSFQTTGYVTWVSHSYFGASTSGVITDNFIRALGNNTLTPHHSGYYQGVTSSGQYVFYAFRASGGHPTFMDLGSNIKGGFRIVASGYSYTNEAGIVEPYNVYRANNDSLGFSRFIATTGELPWLLV